MLSSHIENYLEIILGLQKKHGHAHIRDIARVRKIKMPSVSEALGKLKKKGLVSYQRYGTVSLTKKGEAIAQNVSQRHRTLFNFLHKVLGVSKKIAEEDACRIEHVINPQTLERIRRCVYSPHCKIVR
ncbi:metal-dependent transcriptional regulator [Candidatus Margulisiibacteriota bacterium]